MTQTTISYSEDRWTIIENKFNPEALGKCEVIMAQGNGYMGLRSCTEENYYAEKRNTFVAGTFNKAAKNEVTELPNVPDVIQVRITLNHQILNLNQGTIHHYERSLNLYSGELVRKIVWSTDQTGKVELTFRRMVSMADQHLIAQSIEVKPLDQPIEIDILSGIDGQVTNSGVQHFIEGEKRLFNKEIMTMGCETVESGITMLIACVHRAFLDDVLLDNKLQIQMDRRQIHGRKTALIPYGSTYKLNKYSMIATNRDLEFEGQSLVNIRDRLVLRLEEDKQLSFNQLLDLSTKVWSEKLWVKAPINIGCKKGFDQLAIRFAQYHLQIMTPTHDRRMGIAAKGLTGEGYKGHSFWDTEVFIFPYFLYTQPEVARQLLEYRYLTLSGARTKARVNGYKGAMFPWESAWLEDGEVTPIWGAADIISGEATKIWSGFIEQHITADIAFSVYQYYKVTGDLAFMNQFGYELLFETAIFWSSRLELEADHQYHINEVIGPDEYKEHVDDNAFTNYLVHLNFELAIKFGKDLKDSDANIYNRLNAQFNLEEAVRDWQEKSEKLYLPQPNKDQLIPQDRTYLDKKVIDLTKYKNQAHVGMIFKDYNLEQVNAIQVSKQADVMMLFYLRENLFSQEVKRANWAYYEPKTLHDSSLSLSTHCIIANDIGNVDLAYELFVRCSEIDVGPNMKSSDHGIHAASLGGLLQCVMNGFGGVRVLNGLLRIEPNLPKDWENLKFNFHWRGDVLEIEVNHNTLTVVNTTMTLPVIEFSAFGASYLLTERTTIQLG